MSRVLNNGQPKYTVFIPNRSSLQFWFHFYKDLNMTAASLGHSSFMSHFKPILPCLSEAKILSLSLNGQMMAMDIFKELEMSKRHEW